MEVIWNGTRSGGFNPSLYQLGAPWSAPRQAPIERDQAPLKSSHDGRRLSSSRREVLAVLEQRGPSTAADVAAALCADQASAHRLQEMLRYLAGRGVLTASRETRRSLSGRTYRCHVYALQGEVGR